MNDEATCGCQHCNERITFPLEMAGQKVVCPHCECETVLSTPPAETNPVVNCPCQHCSELIEFGVSKLFEGNTLVGCPHCGKETKLFFILGPATKATLFSVAQDKSRPLEERRAAFKAYSNATKPEREAQVGEIEAFVEQYDTNAKIRSKNDELELEVDKVVIRMRGWANALVSGVNGERSIPISSITAIQMKPGRMMTVGYIHFSHAGSRPFMGGLLEATQNPDCFIFERALNQQVAAFKAKVEQIMRDSKQSTSSSSPGTLSGESRKLAELRQQGLLSQEEFDAAKKKLPA